MAWHYCGDCQHLLRSVTVFSCVVAEMINVVSDNGAGAGESGAEWEELGRIDRSNIGGRQRRV